jgi:sensor histidine kinase YesM
MRFQEKLEYEVLVDDDVDTEQIEVPAMLLQPFVENSIWHGILPMERKGKISIRVFYNENGQLVIEIEDDGIGVEESARVKSTSAHPHVSRGMKITGSRIELLQKMLRRRIMLNGPYQLSDENGQSAGTKVEIIMDLENFEEMFGESKKII